LFEGFIDLVTKSVVTAEAEQLLIGVIRCGAVVVIGSSMDITLVCNSSFVHAAPCHWVHSHADLDPLGWGDTSSISGRDAERDIVLSAIADKAIGSGGQGTAIRALWGPRCVHPSAMRLNSSSLVCLCTHSSANTYLHQPIFFVGGFGEGNFGFFVVFFFVDVNVWGEHGGATMAIGDGVFASPTLNVVIFIVAAFEEDGSAGIGSVAGRLASRAHFFSCRM
jgi:hypothetical protein